MRVNKNNFRIKPYINKELAKLLDDPSECLEDEPYDFYEHGYLDEKARPPKKGYCYDFFMFGRCRYRERCFYKH